jgi:signal peptidase II
LPRFLLSRYRIPITLAILVVAIDLGSKQFVHQHLHGTLNAAGFISLVPTSNSGFSFSALSGHTAVTVVLAITGLLFCVRLLARVESKVATVGLAIIIGGGVSNLVDRALHTGQVSDFIAVSTWFVCNGADIAISLGVVLVLVPFCTGRKVLH